MSSSKVKFVSFESSVGNGFWFKLQENKINVYKLNDERQLIKGFYTNVSDSSKLPCRLSLDYESFDVDKRSPSLCFCVQGSLYNKNTIEDFQNTDLKSILSFEGDMIWDSIINGDAINNPHLLVRFSLLSFADLKKFKFYYWFNFPVIIQQFEILVDKVGSIESESLENQLLEAVNRFCDEFKFLPPFFVLSVDDSFEVHHLSQVQTLLEAGKKLIFVFCDPSSSEEHPGWPLRNFLALINHHWATKLQNQIRIIGLRQKFSNGKRVCSHSLYLKLTLKPTACLQPKFSGWEKNSLNKLSPKIVNLTNCMDPQKLAETSVGLNLKLMKWRLAPSMDLQMIANTKCLLLGAGTLGCNVARLLLSWNVSNITLVDSGNVSFSNPVRQSLFNFSDCSISGGKPKALAAAESLKRIYPGVNAVGYDLKIPMPGYPIYNTEEAIKGLNKDLDFITQLIKDHDVIFLLMDTRESRWLPSVISVANQKLVINAAIGFDTYVVMRHGSFASKRDGSLDYDGGKLGCYFCVDVVAPGNSTADRTLDQQCTVSRPGISSIASAIAVELMVSILHHPDGVLAKPSNLNEKPSVLGLDQHQFRGFIHGSDFMTPTTVSHDKCTACSPKIIENFLKKGNDFLLQVFNSSMSYLEDISGLTQLYGDTDLVEPSVIALSDSDSI